MKKYSKVIFVSLALFFCVGILNLNKVPCGKKIFIEVKLYNKENQPTNGN